MLIKSDQHSLTHFFIISILIPIPHVHIITGTCIQQLDQLVDLDYIRCSPTVSCHDVGHMFSGNHTPSSQNSVHHRNTHHMGNSLNTDLIQYKIGKVIGSRAVIASKECITCSNHCHDRSLQAMINHDKRGQK